MTKIQSQQVIVEVPQAPDISFDDFGPVGRVVAGVTQIAVTIVMEYCSGFFAGLYLGTAAGIPGFLFRPLEPELPKMVLAELGGRFGRMNASSLKWGQSWDGISEAFGGFKVAVSVIRDGKHDDWNQTLSSAAAGALFVARTGKSLVREKALLKTTITNKLHADPTEGPQAMLKGALLYSGMIYVVTGGMSSKRPIDQYMKQRVDF